MRPRLSGGEIVIACSATRTTPMTSRNHLRGESENPVSKARYNAVIGSIYADGRGTTQLEFTWKIYDGRKIRSHPFQLKSQTRIGITGNTDDGGTNDGLCGNYRPGTNSLTRSVSARLVQRDGLERPRLGIQSTARSEWRIGIR